MTKIDDHIDFPLEGLDLSNHLCRGNPQMQGLSTTYDLYAVSNHFGGLGGGHYTAFGKNIDGDWYNFNDSTVTELSSEEEVFKTFGDSHGASGTAYLLMYRKISGTEELYKFSEDLVPEYLKEEIEAETQKLIKEQKVIEEKLLNLNLKVYHEGEMRDITVHKTQTLAELILHCYE